MKQKLDYDILLATMKQVACDVGEALLRTLPRPGTRVTASLKSDQSPVSRYDISAQEVIMRHLKNRFPAIPVVAEERSQAENEEALGAVYFVVDPLDSTKNYVRGIPFFDVSLALVRDGRVVIGVVFDPVHRECYTAVLGEGARCNDARIAVEEVETLEAASIDVNCPRMTDSQYRVVMEQIARRCYKSRYFGNAVLEVCWIAAGRLHGIVNHNLSLWDIAACGLILEEAGGIWSTLGGVKPALNDLLKFPLVAACGHRLHAALVEIIAGAEE